MITFTREIPIRYEVDVLVAGGGPAGVAAAVTAARLGKSVLLIEEGGALGGMGTRGLVPELMNFGDGENVLAGGFGAKMSEKLYGSVSETRATTTVNVEKVKRIYDETVMESGVTLRLFTKLVDVSVENGMIDYAVLSAKQGLFAVRAGVYVDATGDGMLAALAGADFELGNAQGLTMGATLCSLWANVDFDEIDGVDARCLTEAIRDGVISQDDRLLPGIKAVDRAMGVGGGNIGHCFGVNPIDEKSLTDAMILGRKLIVEYETYYKTYLVKGFRRLTLIETADVLGVRESRRIRGDKMLTLDDFRHQTVFEDEIGRYSYPIDIHVETPDQKGIEDFSRRVSIRHGNGESYGIPYGALTPQGLRNVLTAGKCISAAREMQASVRVIPGCYITGQAAGAAAALTCAERDVRSRPVRDIQAALKRQGAYLPNFEE